MDTSVACCSCPAIGTVDCVRKDLRLGAVAPKPPGDSWPVESASRRLASKTEAERQTIYYPLTRACRIGLGAQVSEVQHLLGLKEALIGCFVAMSFSRSVVEVFGDEVAFALVCIRATVAPLGRYCRMSPLVFSLVPALPLCHAGGQVATRPD